MEWILPVLVETRSVHQDILADRQAIAQAQAASQTFHEQLLALAHSTEMGIHQLQQELLLASAIKSKLEESNPPLKLHWPEFSQEDMRLAREVNMTHPDHACAARAGPDGSAAAGLLFTCAQGVIDDPAALLAASTSSTRPSALGAAETLHAVSTPCWAGAAARASVDTSRHDTVRPSAVTEVQRTPLTATEAPLILSEAAATASPGPTTQPVIAVAPGEVGAAAHQLPPKVALKTARCVPAAPAGPAAAEHVPTVEAVPAAATIESGGPPPAPAADAHAQPRLQAAGLDERARARAHEQQRPRALPSDAPSREAAADASRALAPAPAAPDETRPATKAPAPAAAAPAPAAVGTGQPPKEERAQAR